MSPKEESSQQTETLGAPSEPKVQSVRIEAVAGPGKGALVLLRRGSLSVGTDKGCDLAVQDTTVSRIHALIELVQGGVRVRDNGSRNGTFYLGARISEARVPVGGSIRMGRTTLQFSEPGAVIPPSDREALHGLIGRSLAMRRIFSLIEKIAPQNAPVLVLGETGTGKEAVARALHSHSGRSGAFVVFDCSSVSPELIGSELFGHAKGAFTGAVGSRSGLIKSAEGGTLFLDEIGELSIELQPKLLRLLETREYRAVGSDEVSQADLRLIAATHRDLGADTEAERFRKDLWFRLSAFSIEVPPLRDRLEDIPLLAAHFAKARSGVDVSLSPGTLAAFQCGPWPGNLRELRNAVDRAVAFGEAVDSEGAEPASTSFGDERDQLLLKFERDYLVALLTRCQQNLSAAARHAKLSRNQLYRLLQKHGLEREAS